MILILIVPSENKKDSRTIEQTMSDIRTKKRLKISNTELREVGQADNGDELNNDELLQPPSTST